MHKFNANMLTIGVAQHGDDFANGGFFHAQRAVEHNFFAIIGF